MRLVSFAVLFLALGACSQKQISERDILRQQQQDQIAVKRQELAAVAGSYRGTLSGANGYRQPILLQLDVRDVPQTTEQGVDPILIPKLLGYLRFQVGAENSLEYVDAPLVESEYTPANASLYAVARNDQFDQIVLRLELKDGKRLSGSWSAPSVGAGGTLEAVK